MEDSPLTSFIYLGLGLAVLTFWLKEVRQASVDGEPFWPGARRTGWTPLAWGASGALAITLLETGLEVHFDITSEQSTIPSHFLMAMLGAAVVEEMAFRGFGAPGHLRGVKLIVLAVGGSAIFALLHGHGVSDLKGLVSTGSSFAISLWLYACRFSPLNPSRSLAPAMIGHAVRNLAVFGIKDAQGFVSWG